MNEQERIESIKNTNGRSFTSFKRENITYEMCITAVCCDADLLSSVPRELRDYNLYLAACKTNGRILFLVPEENRDMQMCAAAVQSYGAAIRYVPSTLVSRGRETNFTF